jgi:hypothetical protein
MQSIEFLEVNQTTPPLMGGRREIGAACGNGYAEESKNSQSGARGRFDPPHCLLKPVSATA